MVAGWVLGVDERRVGVLGATSLLGEALLSLLAEKGWYIAAYSRSRIKTSNDDIQWRPLDNGFRNSSLDISCHNQSAELQHIPHWVSLAPIWVLPNYFDLLISNGVRRVVVLSSTSRFTKNYSSDVQEQSVAKRLAESERIFINWANQRGLEWSILRPTLVYGGARDKNISEIARFIRRFGFFPLLGESNGLRQPVHADDVAAACVSALEAKNLSGRAYNLSGGETLTYREMVRRVFFALGRSPRLVTVPSWAFHSAVICLRCFPRYRYWTFAMAERMNQDLVFDHEEAARDLGFSPRAFHPRVGDVWNNRN